MLGSDPGRLMHAAALTRYPWPFCELNHFTVPIAIARFSLMGVNDTAGLQSFQDPAPTSLLGAASPAAWLCSQRSAAPRRA